MNLENGPQPLNEVMERLGLTNADLVAASTRQLSFKMLQKGRKGRRLTAHAQKKILTALQAAAVAKKADPAGLPTAASRTIAVDSPVPVFTLKELFNY